MSTEPQTVTEHIRAKIREHMNDISDHISGGACSDHADYTQCCGIIKGLAIAEREILDLEARYQD